MSVDSGSVPDSGTRVDAGTITDAGSTDAGTPVDAGLTDAGITSDAGQDGGVECGPGSSHTFPTFGRSCTSLSDCTIVFHQTDCCGSRVAVGIDDSQESQFETDETLCESQYPACDCASQSIATDTDGGTVPAGEGPGAVVVACVANVCTTNVRTTAACDSATCASDQVCLQECSGIPLPPDSGPLPSFCVGVPASCVGSTSCGCYDGGDPCPTGSCQSVSNGVPLCLCE